MTRTLAALLVGATALVASAARAADAPTGGGKKQYLVTTTHTPEQCLTALDELAAKDQKLLAKTEWGCMDGDHTGWVYVKAASDKEAIAMLPPANRATAKAVMVVVFTPEQLKGIHAKMDQKK